MTSTNGIARIGADVQRASRRLQQLFALTKPRVVSLIVFTAVIGMFLATPGMVALRPVVRRGRHRAGGRRRRRQQLPQM